MPNARREATRQLHLHNASQSYVMSVDDTGRQRERVDELMSVGLFLDDHAWEAQARGDFQGRIFELTVVP